MNFLLASDMDGTVIPLDDGTIWRMAIENFKAKVEHQEDLTLAYVTGRHLDLALAGIDEWGLPVPDVIAADVGTSVYWRYENRFTADDAYVELMSRQMGGFSGADVLAVLAEIPGLTLQGTECQAQFKSSYYAPIDRDQEELTRTVHHALEMNKIQANIVYSVDPHKHVALVDILPRDVAKDYALHYLKDQCSVSAERVVYAGDSGNDLLAFRAGYNAILVANTPDWVKERISNTVHADSVYIATQQCTLGVLEGGRHFGLWL